MKIQEERRGKPHSHGHAIAVRPKTQPIHLVVLHVKAGVSCNLNFVKIDLFISLTGNNTNFYGVAS